MKRWQVGAAVVVALVATSAWAGDVKTTGSVSDDDKAAANRLMKQVESAFNSKNAAAFANLYSENGSLRTPMGVEATGRADIQRVIKKEMDDPAFKNARFSFRMLSLTKLSNDVMMADIANTISGVEFPNMKGAPTAHIFSVVVREGAQWKVAASRGQFDVPKPNQSGVGGSGQADQKKKK